MYVQLCFLHLDPAVTSTLGLRRDLVSLTLNSLRFSYIVKNILVLNKFDPGAYKISKNAS